MILGTSKPRRQPWEIPGFGDGTPMGGQMAQPNPMDTYQRIDAISGEAPAQKRKPNWGGVFTDFLAGVAGKEGPYLASLRAEQERAEKAREYQRQRMDKRDDWQYEQDYKRANPEPGSAYRTEDNAGNVWELDPATGQFKTIFTDPNDKVFMQDGQMVTVPNRVRAQQAPAIPAAAVPQVTDEASYNALPPGAQFRTPDGSVRVKGGAAPAGTPPFAGSGYVPPARLGSGIMTSGRRTPEGNRLVGGVPNSAHLTGEAVDYDGNDLNALLAEARKLPGIRKAFIHDGHVHTEGKGWSAPYYGKRGTKGLKR